MSKPECATPLPLAQLLGYWLAELGDAEEARFEAHLLGCSACASRLARLTQLGDAIAQEVREGRLNSTLTAPFIRRLADAGVRVREYRLEAGGSVNCTVTPEDDVVVARLRVPLENVERLDLVVDDVTAGVRRRMEDVAFDPVSGEIVLAPSVDDLRALGFVTQRVQLVSVQGGVEQVIATYTFNHSPHR